MEYLTTHDLIWINNMVTGNVNRYDYVTLEAAMAGQYLYGSSENVSQQAATLLERMISRRPFESGNLRTAFVALLTFLNANGFDTQADDATAAQLIRSADTGSTAPEEVVARVAAPSSQPGNLAGCSLRQLIARACSDHQTALRSLADGD